MQGAQVAGPGEGAGPQQLMELGFSFKVYGLQVTGSQLSREVGFNLY